MSAIAPKTSVADLVKTAIIGCGLMLVLKVGAYFFTESASIFADATQSMVHLAVLGFLAFSLRYNAQPSSQKRPADGTRANLFSSSFEGAMIIFAGLSTIFVALAKHFAGEEIHSLEAGTILVVISAVFNALFGIYLIKAGRLNRSAVLESNGKHILVSCAFSLLVIASLLFYSYAQNFHWIDPLIATLIGFYTVFVGIRTVRISFEGLLDKTDPLVVRQLTEVLSMCCGKNGIRFEALRHTKAGEQHWVELKLLFHPSVEIGEAHRLASEVELTLISVLSNRAHIVLTLEAEKNASKAKVG